MSTVDPNDAREFEQKLVDAKWQVGRWLIAERTKYADDKVETLFPDLRKETLKNGWSIEGVWFRDIARYLQGVKVLGPNTQHGRQAMGKMLVVSYRALEFAIAEFGPMPKPGLPSGEIQPGA